VAARVAEVITSQPFYEFVRERVFEPLGMVDTAYGVPAGKLDRLAVMYGLPDVFTAGLTVEKIMAAIADGYNQTIDVNETYPTDTPQMFVRGGFGLYSTMADCFRFGQMLANGGQLDGTRVLGRKTIELMCTNHLPPHLLPYEAGGIPNPGWGFGLGSRVMMDVAATGGPGSVGEHGWAGATNTYYWVDPTEELVGILMAQYMMGYERPETDLRSLAYQAIVD
jgi:CubicO group peptidase (beta-lactamase class C family)